MKTPSSNIEVMPTHDVSVTLPMNTKYVSGNPISRKLIRNFLQTLMELVVRVDVKPDYNILDVGCGEGLVSRQLRAIWPDVQLDGLDIELDLLHVAQELVPGLNCLAGSIYDLPFPDRLYNLVLCTEVLEHLDDPDRALAEIARIGSGYFLLTVPNEPWWRLANLARGSYIADWGNTPGHLNHWSSNSFARFVGRHFEIVTVKRPFPWTMILGKK